ncbi:MAG: SHOCT domain-containing protein [Planctomycetota bacterium]|nr:SHOCT domain-containing protein [Planctomycetota bacterium]
MAKLQKLKAMAENGLITQEEYATKKKEILDAM